MGGLDVFGESFEYPVSGQKAVGKTPRIVIEGFRGNARIVGMILLQALVVGFIGYGLGMGLAAAFFTSTSQVTHLAGLHVYWQVMAGVGVAVLVIVMLSSLLSIRRVLVMEPAVVFRG